MLNVNLVCVVSLDLDKWINEPPSDSDGDQVDDAGFFLAPSTSGADFYQTRGHASPASSRSSKRDEQEDDEDVKRVSSGLVFCCTSISVHCCRQFSCGCIMKFIAF